MSAPERRRYDGAGARSIGRRTEWVTLATKRAKIILGVTVLVVAVIVAVVVALLTTSSSPRSTTTGSQAAGGGSRPSSFTHAQYTRSFALATIGKMPISALDQWPAPYQSYHDQYGQRCYEWNDVGHALFNLCFSKKGLLAIKVIE